MERPQEPHFWNSRLHHSSPSTLGHPARILCPGPMMATISRHSPKISRPKDTPPEEGRGGVHHLATAMRTRLLLRRAAPAMAPYPDTNPTTPMHSYPVLATHWRRRSTPPAVPANEVPRSFSSHALGTSARPYLPRLALDCTSPVRARAAPIYTAIMIMGIMVYPSRPAGHPNPEQTHLPEWQPTLQPPGFAVFSRPGSPIVSSRFL